MNSGDNPYKENYSTAAENLTLREQAGRLYGFLSAMTGHRETAEVLTLQALERPQAESSGDFLFESIQWLLPSLLAGGDTAHKAENSFSSDPELEARVTWALQILNELKPDEKVRILLRDQLEWPIARIAECFKLSVEGAGERLRHARAQFNVQKEMMQTRRKWRA